MDNSREYAQVHTSWSLNCLLTNVPVSGLLTEGSFLLLSSGCKKVIALRAGLGYLKKKKGGEVTEPWSQGDRALREDQEKLQWWFGQGTSEVQYLIGCEPTSPPLTQQHLQESHNPHGCVCVRGFFEWSLERCWDLN